MTPRTTAGAEGHTNLHGRLPEKADRQANIDGAIDEHLHPGPSLRVPDVKVDCAGICMSGIANDPWWGSQTDAVLVDSGVEDGFSILGGNGLATSEEGHVHEFTERARRRDLASNRGSFRNDGTYEGFQPGEVRRGRDTGHGEAKATIGQAEGFDEESALRGVDEGGNLRSKRMQFNQSRSINCDNE